MRRPRPLFNMGFLAPASCLLNALSAHRIMEQLVDSNVFLKTAYFADDRPAARWIEERTPYQWSDGASVTVVIHVARAVGNCLGGNRLAGFGLVAIALSIRRPKPVHPQEPASR